jgi:hypothetical protein
MDIRNYISRIENVRLPFFRRFGSSENRKMAVAAISSINRIYDKPATEFLDRLRETRTGPFDTLGPGYMGLDRRHSAFDQEVLATVRSHSQADPLYDPFVQSLNLMLKNQTEDSSERTFHHDKKYKPILTEAMTAIHAKAIADHREFMSSFGLLAQAVEAGKGDWETHGKPMVEMLAAIDANPIYGAYHFDVMYRRICAAFEVSSITDAVEKDFLQSINRQIERDRRKGAELIEHESATSASIGKSLLASSQSLTENYRERMLRFGIDPATVGQDGASAKGPLDEFFSRYGRRLAAASIGGSMVLGVIAGAISPANAADRTEMAALRADMDDMGLPRGAQFGVGVMAAPTADDTIFRAKDAIAAKGDIDAMADELETRKGKLENAARELDNLKAAIENAQALDPQEHREAVAAAAEIYNEAVAQAQVGFDDVSIDGEATADALPSTSDVLNAFHQGY